MNACNLWTKTCYQIILIDIKRYFCVKICFKSTFGAKIQSNYFLIFSQKIEFLFHCTLKWIYFSSNGNLMVQEWLIHEQQRQQNWTLTWRFYSLPSAKSVESISGEQLQEKIFYWFFFVDPKWYTMCTCASISLLALSYPIWLANPVSNTTKIQ